MSKLLVLLWERSVSRDTQLLFEPSPNQAYNVHFGYASSLGWHTIVCRGSQVPTSRTCSHVQLPYWHNFVIVCIDNIFTKTENAFPVEEICYLIKLIIILVYLFYWYVIHDLSVMFLFFPLFSPECWGQQLWKWRWQCKPASQHQQSGQHCQH